MYHVLHNLLPYATNNLQHVSGNLVVAKTECLKNNKFFHQNLIRLQAEVLTHYLSETEKPFCSYLSKYGKKNLIILNRVMVLEVSKKALHLCLYTNFHN